MFSLDPSNSLYFLYGRFNGTRKDLFYKFSIVSKMTLKEINEAIEFFTTFNQHFEKLKIC